MKYSAIQLQCGSIAIYGKKNRYDKILESHLLTIENWDDISSFCDCLNDDDFKLIENGNLIDITDNKLLIGYVQYNR